MNLVLLEHCFKSMIINGSETLIEHIYANVNVNLMEANVIQIKSRMKNWIFKIYYFKSIIGDSIVTYTEILDTVAKSYYQLTNFKQKKLTCKMKFSIFYLPLY